VGDNIDHVDAPPGDDRRGDTVVGIDCDDLRGREDQRVDPAVFISSTTDRFTRRVGHETGGDHDPKTHARGSRAWIAGKDGLATAT